MGAGPSQRLTIPPLVSGGVMLSYRCTNECRHCLYRCSPRQPDEWMTLDMAERVFGALGAEAGLGSIHLAGGEPTIRMGLLVEVIRLAVEAGIRLSYAETNAHWCTDRETAREGFERLKGAGLPGVLVSASMFHNEFVPFRNTRACVEAAREVFGSGGTYIYLPHTYEILSQMPDDGRHTLDEFSEWAGIKESPDMVARLYQVIPNGRAVDALRDSYTPREASSFRGEGCMRDLMSTTHFHIDHHGDLFTGLCAGLAPATIDDLHPEITERSHPVFHRLALEGPYGLMRMAVDAHGYRERESGYVSRCDLCMGVRGALERTGKFPELRPASFYAA
ncbi:MAG: radical SAM protein, partial [Planctomycetota bacterium]